MKHRIHPLDNFSPISRVRTIENKRKREWKQIDEYIGMTREQFMRGLVTRVSSRYQIRDDRGHLIGYWSNHEPEDITSIVDNRVVFKKPIMNVQELQQVA